MNRRFLTAAFALSMIAAPLAATAAPVKDAAQMPAGTYALDKTHASVVGSVMHLGYSRYTFRFDTFDASIIYDPANPDDAQVKVTIEVGSMNTGIPNNGPTFAREFLKSDSAPTATFVSTGLTRTGETGKLAGNLTLAGVTKPVVLDVTFHGAGKGMRGENRVGFSASTVIKRSEFGSGKLQGPIGDEVTLAIEVEFTKS